MESNSMFKVKSDVDINLLFSPKRLSPYNLCNMCVFSDHLKDTRLHNLLKTYINLYTFIYIKPAQEIIFNKMNN